MKHPLKFSHRPGYDGFPAPAPPAGLTAFPEKLPAHTYSEFVWQFKHRREQLGFPLSQIDHAVGWGETLTSKLELPHRDVGRIAGGLVLIEWAQALRCGLLLVPDEAVRIGETP